MADGSTANMADTKGKIELISDDELTVDVPDVDVRSGYSGMVSGISCDDSLELLESFPSGFTGGVIRFFQDGSQSDKVSCVSL